MATEFDNSAHYAVFTTSANLNSTTGKYARWSEVVVSALRAAGMLDNVEDSTTAPSDKTKLWLDKNSDPATMKRWSQSDSAWIPVSYDYFFSSYPVAIKQPVKVATTTNITLSGEQTIDGVSIVDGDRVLVKDQSLSEQNGIYAASIGAWSRTSDASNTGDLDNGTLIITQSGTVNSSRLFVCSTVLPEIGTDSISFAMYSQDQSRYYNWLINADGGINTTGASSGVTDDTYAWDQHIVLTQSAAVTVSTVSTPGDGITSFMRLTQSDATAQRMGVCQILSNADSRGKRGKTVTLGGKLRVTAAATIRYAVLEWTGTADSVTSDPVTNWASTSYTAGGFFVGSGYTIRSVGSTTPTVAAITDWSLTATLGSSLNNLVFMYWTEGAVAQNAAVDMRWYLVDGRIRSGDDPFSARHRSEEERLCRYFYREFNGTGYGGFATGTGAINIGLSFDRMRIAPVASLLDSSISIRKPGGVTASTGSVITSQSMTESGGDLLINGFSGLTLGDPIQVTNGTNRTIALDARL